MKIINLYVNKPPKERYVYCARPSALGNPFNIIQQSRTIAVKKYEEYLRQQITERNDPVLKQLRLIIKFEQQGGCTLGCWCTPLACHCDVIIKLIKEKKYVLVEKSLDISND